MKARKRRWLTFIGQKIARPSTTYHSPQDAQRVRRCAIHRIDSATRDQDKFGAGKDGFTGGDPQAAIAPTHLTPDWYDAVQEEIANVIEGAGITLSKGTRDQLLSAIQNHIADGGYRFKQVVVATSDATWNRPSDVRAVRVTCVGGGGGGGGADARASGGAVGGGGGGGGTATRFITTGLGSSESVVVGAGGAGGVGTATDESGADGGDSSFGAHATGVGGKGGAGVDNQTSTITVLGGDGGGGTAGVVVPGGAGHEGLVISGAGQIGGHGGNSTHGAGGKCPAPASPGNDGSGFGAGGSGARATNGQSAEEDDGGAGTDGIVIIEEYV